MTAIVAATANARTHAGPPARRRETSTAPLGGWYHHCQLCRESPYGVGIATSTTPPLN